MLKPMPCPAKSLPCKRTNRWKQGFGGFAAENDAVVLYAHDYLNTLIVDHDFNAGNVSSRAKFHGMAKQIDKRCAQHINVSRYDRHGENAEL